MPNFIMLVGVPGAGKSTYAQKINAQENGRYTIISRDDIMMEFAQEGQDYTQAFKTHNASHVDATLDARLKQALAERKDIIYDQTNLTVKSRKRKLSQVSSDYTKYAVYFTTTKDIMYERATKRIAEGKVIPTAVLDSMYSTVQVPTKEEGFNTVIYQ